MTETREQPSLQVEIGAYVCPSLQAASSSQGDTVEGRPWATALGRGRDGERCKDTAYTHPGLHVGFGDLFKSLQDSGRRAPLGGTEVGPCSLSEATVFRGSDAGGAV